jgi:hypothetical protein
MDECGSIRWQAFAATSSSGAALMAAFLAFTSFRMVQIHSMVWSEPLFILLSFSGFFFSGVFVAIEALDAVCIGGKHRAQLPRTICWNRLDFGGDLGNHLS